MKKRNLVLGFMLIMLLALSTGLMAQTYSGGSGTEGAPYQIANKADLKYLSDNSGEWSKHFIQTANITFDDADFQSGGDFYNSGGGFSPIGNNSTKFTGSYDGDEHTIDNLYIDRSGVSFIGLFGSTNGGTISNLGVTDVDITGNLYVGGLMGENNNSCTVSNCYSTGSVSGGGDDVGGLVGYNNNSTVSNCYSTGSVSGSGDYVGGLVGYNSFSPSVTVSNSYSTSSVSGGGDDVGGLVGFNDATVSNSFWDTETSGQSSSAGGTGKTTAQMKTLSTFTDAGWDFEAETTNGTDDYWDMDQPNGSGYPFLSWENGDETALPITLSHFKAVYQNGTIFLSWQTASETENLAFRIYRDEEMITELDGAGTTTEPQDYHYTDNHIIPGKTYIYVLADVTIGNKEVKHSDKAITITVGEGNITEDYSIGSSYPNPFNPSCMIPLNLAVNAKVKAGLYDLNGRLVNELHNGALSAGSHDLKIDGANLTTGIYLVKVRINDALHIQKIVLMK